MNSLRPKANRPRTLKKLCNMWRSFWAKTNRSRLSVHYVKAHSECKPTDQCHYSNTWSSLCGDNEQWRWANLVTMFKGQWCRAKTKTHKGARIHKEKAKWLSFMCKNNILHPDVSVHLKTVQFDVHIYMFQDGSTWCQHNYVSRLFNLMST